MARMSGGGAQAPNGQNISFANSGGASPPMGVSGGAGAGVGGGGMQQAAIPGSNTGDLNRMIGGSEAGVASGFGSEGSLQAGQAGQMSNPQMMNRNPSVSVLTDLTSGVGPPLGTSGYGMATQGNVGNPAGRLGTPNGQGGHEFGTNTGTASEGATIPNGGGPGSASMGQNLSQLISPGDKSNMGRTIPKGKPSNNSLDLNRIYPQTGYKPYSGVLG